MIPRHGGSSEIRWFEAEPTYVLHWANAYEDGDEVVVDGFFQGCPEPDGARRGAGPPTACSASSPRTSSRPGSTGGG